MTPHCENFTPSPIQYDQTNNQIVKKRHDTMCILLKSV